MGVVVAGTWQGSSDPSASVAIPVTGFQAGDLCVVMTAAYKTTTYAIATPTDDGGNVYTPRAATTWDATFFSLVGVADCVVVTPPTVVTANISVVGAIDATVLRIKGALAAPFAQAFAKKQTSANPATDSVGVQPGDIVVAGASTDGIGTLIAEQQWSIVGFGSYVYRVFPTEQSVTHTWSNTAGSEDTSMVIGAYRPGASGSDLPFVVSGRGAC